MTNLLTCYPFGRSVPSNSMAANAGRSLFYTSLQSMGKGLDAEQQCSLVVLPISLPSENTLWVVS